MKKRKLFTIISLMFLMTLCCNNVYANEETPSREDEPIVVDPDISYNDVVSLSKSNPELLANYIVLKDEKSYGDVSSVTETITLYDEAKGIYPRSVELYYKLTKASPTLAASAGYYACFSKVQWIKRGNVWSLSIYPKFAANGYSKDDAFRFLKEVHVENPQWNYKNVNSMKNQFVCHYDLTSSFKTPWNIEPSKADKGYWGFVASLCN